MAGKLDLRTGQPVWEAYPAPEVETAPLVEDVAADVLVVGLAGKEDRDADLYAF